MAAPPPPARPTPNAANIRAAITGMTAEGNTIAQSVQTFNNHQQNLTNELAHMANYDTNQLRTQLVTLTQMMTDRFDRIDAQ